MAEFEAQGCSSFQQLNQFQAPFMKFCHHWPLPRWGFLMFAKGSFVLQPHGGQCLCPPAAPTQLPGSWLCCYFILYLIFTVDRDVWWEGAARWGQSLLPGNKWQGEGKQPQDAPEEVWVGYWQKCLHWKVVQGLKQTAQGTGSHQAWKCSRTTCMWHFGTWAGGV